MSLNDVASLRCYNRSSIVGNEELRQYVEIRNSVTVYFVYVSSGEWTCMECPSAPISVTCFVRYISSRHVDHWFNSLSHLIVEVTTAHPEDITHGIIQKEVVILKNMEGFIKDGTQVSASDYCSRRHGWYSTVSSCRRISKWSQPNKWVVLSGIRDRVVWRAIRVHVSVFCRLLALLSFPNCFVKVLLWIVEFFRSSIWWRFAKNANLQLSIRPKMVSVPSLCMVSWCFPHVIKQCEGANATQYEIIFTTFLQCRE